MKPKAGTEVFELIPSQKMINFMLKYSFFHKQVIQIPMSIVTSTPIDFDVLKKALNIEIERNDCMRLRFYKEHPPFKGRGLPHHLLQLLRRQIRNIYQRHPSVHGCRRGICVLLRSACGL